MKFPWTGDVQNEVGCPPPRRYSDGNNVEQDRNEYLHGEYADTDELELAHLDAPQTHIQSMV